MVDVPSSVAVVVPARNEERRLDACLRALTAAIRRLRSSNEVRPVRVVLVLDRCTDRTAAVVTGWPSVEVVVTDQGRVGGARAAGVRYANAAADRDVDAMWIANTTRIPRCRPTGRRPSSTTPAEVADLVLGMVCPDPAEVPDELRVAWHDRHAFIDGHRHVHGANMGVRGGMYLSAGGFPDVAVDEDVALAESIRAGWVAGWSVPGPVR